MKTANIVQSHIFGTNSGRCIVLQYKGKTLHSLTGQAADNPKMLGAVLKWAFNQGFTHWRDGNRNVLPIDPKIQNFNSGI